MVVEVSLHTVLQRQEEGALRQHVILDLQDGATVGDVMKALEISMPIEALILVVNHRVVDDQAVLSSGDHLDIVPAISGG